MGSSVVILLLVLLSVMLPVAKADSLPGSKWERTSEFASLTSCWSIATDGSTLVSTGHPVISASQDGKTWHPVQDASDTGTRAVAFGNGTFAAISFEGKVLHSRSGWKWTIEESPGPKYIYSMIWTGGSFVAVGLSGTIARSEDGIKWSEVKSGTTRELAEVVSWSGKLIAVGSNGTILQSNDDGLTWSSVPSEVNDNLSSCVPVPGGILFAGRSGFTKWDGGSTWTQTSYPDCVKGGTFYTNSGPHRLRTNGKEWIMTSEEGQFAVSSDAETWQLIPIRTDHPGLARDLGTADSIFFQGNWHILGDKGVTISGESGITLSQTSLTREPQMAIIYSGGRYLSFSETGGFHESFDGINWTAHRFSLINEIRSNSQPWRDATQKAGKIVCVGNKGKIGTISTHDTNDSNSFFLPQHNTLWGISSSSDRFVAVGEDGLITTSVDGDVWQAVPSVSNGLAGARENLTSITHDGNRFLAVSASGSLLESNTGLVWTARKLGLSAELLRIRHTSRGTLACGKNGKIFHSPDGVNWVERSSGTTSILREIVETPTGLFALGDSGSIVQSLDNGITWTSQITDGRTIGNIHSAHYHDGKLVTIGGSWEKNFKYGHFNISLSPFNFILRDNLPPDLFAVCNSPKGILAAGAGGSILRSTDTIKWIREHTNTTSTFYDITSNSSTTVAVGSSILISEGSGPWFEAKLNHTSYGNSVPLSISRSNYLKSITRGAGKFVCCGGGSTIYISEDGKSWRSPSSFPVNAGGDFEKILWANGRFTVASSNAILTSVDGEVWTSCQLPSSGDIKTLFWTGSEFWAPLNTGSMLASPDGINWHERAPPHAKQSLVQRYYRPDSGETEIFAFGRSETLESSSDGVNWTPHSPPVGIALGSYFSSYEINDLKKIDNLFIAVGTRGYIATSPDSRKWSYVHRHLFHTLSDIKFIRDRFIAVGSHILSSTDGTRWIKHLSPSLPSGFSSISANENIAVTVGNGAIYRSTDLDQWNEVVIPNQRSWKTVHWNGSKFIAADDSTSAISADGIEWTIGDGSNYLKPSAIASNNNITIVAGLNIHSSTDGLSWTKRDSKLHNTGIVWTGSRFIATGDFFGYSSSTDGMTWNYAYGLPENPIRTLWTGSDLIAFQDSEETSRPYPEPAKVFHSADGLSWTPLGNVLHVKSPTAIAASGRRLVAVGRSGDVAISDPSQYSPYARFLEEEGAAADMDLSLTGDPDGDGVPSAIATYLGIPPLGSASTPQLGKLPRVSTNPGELPSFRFTRALAPPAFLEASIEESLDLKHWRETARRYPDGSWAGEMAVEETEINGEIEVKLTPLIAPERGGFWRLKVGPATR